MERIAFVGLGTMGAAMAANLARAGFEVTVWNRTPGRAPELDELGRPARGHAGRSRGGERRRRHLRLGHARRRGRPVRPGRRRRGARSGTLVIDCSTIAPAATRDFAARLAERGVAIVDAPVSGGSEGAQKATLTIFVGGEPAAVERARPVLAALGKTITHVGPIGAGQAVKAVNQVILAGTYLGVAEGIVLAMKAGLDVDQVVGALGGGAAQSWVLANRSGRMLDERLPARVQGRAPPQGSRDRPRAAERVGARPAGRGAGGGRSRTASIAGGHGDDDMSALARSIRARSGLPGLSRTSPSRLRPASRRAASGRRACPRSAAGSDRCRTSRRRRPCAARGPARAASCGRTCRPGSRPSAR